MKMNEVEQKAFELLLKKGYREEDIDFSQRRSVDFIAAGKLYEVKVVHGGYVQFTQKQYNEFKSTNPTILVFNEDGQLQAEVPFKEIEGLFKVQKIEKGTMERVTVLLEREDLKKLEDLSREKGISLSALIRMVVKEWLRNLK